MCSFSVGALSLSSSASASSMQSIGKISAIQEINNRVFADILHGKATADSTNKTTCDKSSVKVRFDALVIIIISFNLMQSDDWGSVRSSLLSKHDSDRWTKRKKLHANKIVTTEQLQQNLIGSGRTAEAEICNKPLIAKMKSGAKLHNTSESEGRILNTY